MAKVAIIFTGGTISMKQDKSGGVVPKLDGAEIVRMVPALRDLAEIVTIDFSRKPGPHVGPIEMWELRNQVIKILAEADIDGVVITHGTDTLEETAYLLDLTINPTKPVVLVGAMRNSSEEDWDGPDNLINAVITALAPEAQQLGVLVVMHGKIFAAGEVTKINTQSVEAFDSPDTGPVGTVSEGRVRILRWIQHRRHILCNSLETKVDLIKTYSGMDDKFIQASMANGAKGLVLEAMGCGNIPPALIPALQKATLQGVKVMIVSRCIHGEVDPVYGYDGGGRQLQELGMIFGENLPGQKARIKLMAALAVTNNSGKLQQLLE